ncbi:MAG: DUF916 and DUF3324 domain-containing protein [Actinomycetes bacterium]|jgi:hypothetical protein|nr:DUF916 and DUF3324 domain-containing protein [Actinomycetes bacterium]
MKRVFLTIRRTALLSIPLSLSIISIGISVASIAIFFAVLPGAAHAAPNVKFSVQALLPDSQRDSSVSYFDVRLKPGQSETLRVRVTNNDSQPKRIRVSAIAASTNGNGVIEYTKPDIIDPSLAHPFNQLARVIEPDFTLQPNASKVVVTEVTMPPEEFDGVILGGIHVMDIDQHKKANAESDDAVVISNRYSYALGALLSETDAPVLPAIEGDKAYPTLTGGYTSVIHDIRNTAPAIAKEWELHIEVYRKGDMANIIRELDNDNVNMAPNSSMPYVLFWDGAIDPGDYISRVTMRDTEGDTDDVSFDLPWSVSYAQAQELNDQAVDAEPSQFPWLWVIIIAAMALIILALIIILWKRRRKEDKENEVSIEPAPGLTGGSTPEIVTEEDAE